MTEPDLEAIYTRVRLHDGAELNLPTGEEIVSRWQSWEKDVPDLLELVKTVKLGWQQEKDRADLLELELDASEHRVKLLEGIIKGYQGQG